MLIKQTKLQTISNYFLNLFFRISQTISKVIHIIIRQLQEIPLFFVNVAQERKVSQETERLVAAFQFTYLYIFKYIGIDRKIIQSFFDRSSHDCYKLFQL